MDAPQSGLPRFVRIGVLTLLVCGGIACDADDVPPSQNDPAPMRLASTKRTDRYPAADWWTDRFWMAHLALNDGDGFSRETNDAGTLAWAESYLLRAYLEMYRVTMDDRYLRVFVRHAERVVASTDENRGIADWQGRSEPVWSTNSQRYTDGRRIAFPLHTAMITLPLLEFVLLARTHDDLPESYREIARRLERVAVRASATMDESLQRSHSNTESFVVVAPNSPRSGSSVSLHAPLNEDAAVGLVYLALWRITEEEPYRRKAAGIARHLRASMTRTDNGMVWTYLCADRRGRESRPEDLSHGAIEAEFAVVAFRAGLVFSEVDMVQLGQTLESLWVPPAGFAWLIGEPTSVNQGACKDPAEFHCPADSAGRWLALTPFYPMVHTLVRQYLLERLETPTRVHPVVLLSIANLLAHAEL